MAIYLNVFLERAKVPAFAEWEKGITDAQLPLSFPESVELTKHTGYLPALLNDEESGFEFFLSDVAESDEVPDEIRSALPSANAIATFRYHEMHESLAATIGASVLAQLGHGFFFDPQDGRTIRGSEALAEARKALDTAARKERETARKRPELLSPLKWAKAFEQTLHRVHPEYALSADYRGRDVECLREDATGLYLSQNCTRMHDRYSHCFAVLFTRAKLRPVLHSPLILGSRFDHNSTIAHAYNSDYREGMKWHVAPQEWHSEYRATLRGTQQWLESTARTAEAFLRPLYLTRLSRGADRFTALLHDAAQFLQQWEVTAQVLEAPVADTKLIAEFALEFHLSSKPADWDQCLVRYYNALRLADSNGYPGLQLLKYRRQAINAKCDDILRGSDTLHAIPAHIRNAAIFVVYAEDFLTVQAELPGMIRLVEKVKESLPARIEKLAGPKAPWWRIW